MQGLVHLHCGLAGGPGNVFLDRPGRTVTGTGLLEFPGDRSQYGYRTHVAENRRQGVHDETVAAEL